MRELFVATRNRGKLREIKSFLSGVVEQVYCSLDFEGLPETIEDCATIELNALKKAREAVRFTGLPALADDSGLMVEALDGRPGVLSARFAGENADDGANNRKLLEELNGVPAELRKAAFVCALAYVTSDGYEEVFLGRVEGYVLAEGRGSGGFGYDPLFLVDEFGLTMAELDIEQKNRISHRGQALVKFRTSLVGANRCFP